MGKKYMIGIDGGSQSTKVVMYDLEGNVICEGKENLQPMYQPDANTVEHPGDDLWVTLARAGKKLMSSFPGDPKDIIGIGLGSIRCCRVLLKADGTLAGQVISWQDTRVNRPYEHTNPEVAYVTSTSGYLAHRLTGNFNDNVANYFGQWPVDFTTWQWSEDQDVIKKFNIPRNMLFNLVEPGSVLGSITADAAMHTGFPEGLPVVATTSDKPVEALGAGLIDEKSAVISLGTYITLMIDAKEIPKNPEYHWAVMASVPNRLIYECNGIRRGMWTVSWLREMLGETLLKNAEAAGLSPENFLNKQAEKVPAGCEGLITVLDWLTNPWEPFKRGMLIGFQAHMDYAYMYRSILEAVALTMKNNYDDMCREINRKVDRIIVSGGGSNSDLFMQIFADVFQMPAVRNTVNGTASMGAAINTAVAVGAYPSYEEAVERMVTIQDTFYPIPANVAVYERFNQGLFRDLASYTDVIAKKSYGIFNTDKQEAVSISGWSQT